MYSTCLFCHNDLGSNAVVEHFPVGRRLAFDGARGRLWVVCRACERWNLTPLEERWEAIEECEKLFRGTTLRMSTEHIGLARVSEGLQLVRVGDPQRPEMAAWRYGDQFSRRRKKYWALTGAGVIAVGALVVGHLEFGLMAGTASTTIFNIGNFGARKTLNRHARARVPTSHGRVNVSVALLKEAEIVRSKEDQWSLRFGYSAHTWKGRLGAAQTDELPLRQAAAALGALLPAVNAAGASKSKVEAAVAIIQNARTSDTLTSDHDTFGFKSSYWNANAEGKLVSLPSELRLALEMVTHEDDERRAFEGELAELEQRWKEAEEIADISDNMFVPSSVTDWIKRVKP